MTNVESDILTALRRITRAIDLRSRALLVGYGLTTPQLVALDAVRRAEPVCVADLANEIHLGRPTVTGILNRLEARGLIQRVRDDRDRRSVHVTLTPSGREVLENAPPLFEARFQQELAELRPWEQTQILSTLQRIGDMMNVGEVSFPLLPEEDIGSHTTSF